MDVLFPLQQALKTPLGDILLFLLLALLVFSILQLYFWVRYGRKKDLGIYHHHQFKKTEKLLKDYNFKGIALSDFFGRKQLISLFDGRYGQCLIMYPELCNESVFKRFEQYHLLMQRQAASYFPINFVKLENNQLVNVETQFMKANGETLINLGHYSMDKTFSDAEKEHFLIDVAYMLEALHQIKTESGESLYHGFLLPTSFYFSMNIVKKITHIYLSNYGYAFALAPKHFQKWISKLLNGTYILDAFSMKHLQDFKFILSPEQTRQNWHITSSTDFYSFAALAVYLFTQKPFNAVSEINWSMVPAGWRVFLKECLNSQPEERPSHFLELQEYFNAPDVQIAIESSIDDSQTIAGKEGQLSSIQDYFEQVQQSKVQAPFFDQEWQEGYSAIKNQSWHQAQFIFEEMQKEGVRLFDAQLGLALLYYQKGEKEKAREHYMNAKKIDAKRINNFYKLISFDI